MTPTAFERLCRERRAAGIKQYRGGDPYAPFVGDPIQEVYEELADACIYLQEAALQGRIHPEVAFEADHWLRCAIRTVGDGLRRAKADGPTVQIVPSARPRA